MNWHALAAATRADAPRLPFSIGQHRAGSVARAHLPALQGLDEHLVFEPGGVRTRAADPTAALARLNVRLRALGLIRAWRDETYPIVDPASGRLLALTERAASRFWGTLTFGAHATGYVADAQGRPTHLWIAQRSPHKATDPGLFDNLVGGGVPAGQTPAQALVREGFEEAGLAAPQLAAARPASVLRLQRDIPEGFQHEWLYSFDLELPPGLQPVNQDGEVAGFTLMPLAQAAELAAGADMTVDAALVTIDFLHRHGVLDDGPAARRLRELVVPAAQARVPFQ